jgi:superfamily II DNA/RNA helicase
MTQVAREFESACPSLSVVSVYGGVSIGGQMKDLERGADVVVSASRGRGRGVG